MLLGIGILWMVWLALTRTLDVVFVVAGLVSSVLVVAFWRALMPQVPASLSMLLRHPIRLARFVIVLIRRFVHSTLRTTWLILTGGEEGRMMALPIRIEDSLARFILLNSITLTPSTISLLIEDNLLYIHWLQPAGGHGDWREIKESFELRLQALFEEDGHADH